MSTHNICFRGEIIEILCGYPLISGVMTSHTANSHIPKHGYPKVPAYFTLRKLTYSYILKNSPYKNFKIQIKVLKRLKLYRYVFVMIRFDASLV